MKTESHYPSQSIITLPSDLEPFTNDLDLDTCELV